MPNRRYSSRLSVCLLLLGLPLTAHAQEGPRELLQNGGFEGGSGSDGRGGGVPGWMPFESGYDVDRRTTHSGDQCIRCDSLSTHALHGAQQQITLNQKQPIPIHVSGWSRADQVGGSRDGDYAVYADLEYMDGTPLWGEAAPFRAGTHDWERRQFVIIPEKPIKTVTIYALFRHHAGTAWFDDFSAQEMAGSGLFDSQALPALPVRPTGLSPNTAGKVVHVAASDGLALEVNSLGEITTVTAGGQDVSSVSGGGFFVRDVAADGPPVPMHGAAARTASGGVSIDSASEALHVRFSAKIAPQADSLAVDGELTDTTNTDRAVTVYLVLPINAIGWQWGQDIRHAETIQPGREYSNQTHVTVGTTGTLSLYPFACVASTQHGVGIANQMEWPSVYRLFYNGATRQLVIAWDFALTSKTAAWPARNARFRCRLFRLQPDQAAWGFRAAARRFYRLNAPDFDRRAKADGIWMPFTDPSKVQNPADFGFAYHEGDNSLKSDDAFGILSFRYTEPMTYWLPMPPEIPRTYDDTLALLKKNADGPPGDARNFARATLNCGTQDENGRFNLELRNEPWNNGAVFALDPNPEMPATPDQPTKASLSYTIPMAMQMYSEEAKRQRGEQGGEYLDSLEGWSDVHDYRPSNVAACPYPIPFDTDTRRPVVPEWYHTHTFARFLHDDLHNRGKLLMANTAYVRFSIYAPLLDVAGIEVNWLDTSGRWQPDGDAVFNLRRTLSAQKPYLLLMNTDFDKFTPPLVEKYFQRSLFYGVFPSMFSANAANNPYWETPKWYNRDRPLFQKYIPILKRLSAAGWEPITYARSAQPAISVERFGPRLFTLLNDSAQPHDTTLTIDLRALGLQAAALHVVNLLTNAEIPSQRSGSTLSITLHLNGEETQVLELR